MVNQEPKKAWAMPELIVLLRSKPEEAVLAACKQDKGGLNTGLGHTNNGCFQVPSCVSCLAVGLS